MAQPIPILMYHSIDSSCSPAYRRWVVSPDRFAAQLAVLRDRGARPMTVSDLVAWLDTGAAPPPGCVAITFDDGLADFAEQALPILERFGFAATLYVTTGFVGQTSRWLAGLGEGGRPMMDWCDIARLVQRNVECGAHTHAHSQLDLLGKDQARLDIARSKERLEDKIGRPVTSFAYPHGYSTRAVREMVGDLGFTSACRVAHALSSSEESRFALSRIIMTQETTDEQLAGFLEGRGLRTAPPLVTPQALGWRACRKVRALAGRWRGPIPAMGGGHSMVQGEGR